MNSASAANKYLASLGHPELFVNKAEGVWYLLGGDDSRYDPFVERCLHTVRIDDVTPDVLRWKLDELAKA